MKTVTAEQRAALKNRVKMTALCRLKIASTWYYLTNSDTSYIFGGNTYLPGYLLDIDDIEISSNPKVEDSEIVIDGNDSIFTGLFLSQNWMNNSIEVIGIYSDKNGAFIRSEIAYRGFMTDVSFSDAGSHEISVTVSGFFADWLAQRGIKTNATSQQIHYPDCTGFENTAKATKASAWGKESENTAIRPSSSGSKFPDPRDR